MADDIRMTNQKVAQDIEDEAKNNPHSPYVGKFVGIANGQVVAVADNWDQLARRVLQIEPNPAKTFCIEVGRDYSAVQEIWGLSLWRASSGRY